MAHFWLKNHRFTYIYLCWALLLPQVMAETVKIRLLQTTDVHSYIEHSDNPQEGGWLRLATLIKKHRANNSCLLIDTGDTIQGSLSGIASKGEAAIDLINHLKYDFWVLGNHELDFGIPRLADLLEKTQVPILNGNFKLTGPYKRSFPSWEIREIKGVKVCVVGMQASYLNHWFIGQNFKQYEVRRAYEVLEREMPQILAERPHVIVLALHQGFLFKDKRGVNEIASLCRRFPEIDLILGGHTHQLHPGRNLHGVYYSQAAYHASHLGVIDVTVDLSRRQVVRIDSKLEKAGSEIAKDQDAAAVYHKWRQKTKEFSTVPVVTLKEPIKARGRVGKNCAISFLIAESLRVASGADLALHGRFTSSDLVGEVTEKDLFKVIPYENNIFLLTVSKEQLTLLIKEQLLYYGSRSFHGPAGFKIELEANGRDLKQLILSTDKKSYTLAVNSRVAAGGGGRFLWLKKEIKSGRLKAKEVQINTREALKQYLQSFKGPLQVPPNVF